MIDMARCRDKKSNLDQTTETDFAVSAAFLYVFVMTVVKNAVDAYFISRRSIIPID